MLLLCCECSDIFAQGNNQIVGSKVNQILLKCKVVAGEATLKSRQISDAYIGLVYVETDGEVTITYPTGEGATFIKNGENWILSGYRVVTDGNYMLNIGFLDNNFVECTEIDENGVVMKRTTIPYVFDGSLLLEQLDVQSLPRSLIEIKRKDAE